MKKDKTTRFLAISIALVVLLCVVIFSFLALYMNRQTAGTISEVGGLYMSSTSEQIAMHFETTIGLRLAQVEALVETLPPWEGEDATQREELIYAAQARGFSHLALYSSDGQFEMLYGEPVQVTDPPPFLQSLNAGEKKIAVGTDQLGNNITLLGVSSTYSMSGGRQCTALVAGISVDYIRETLSLDVADSPVYSHIIRKDGSFVIRSAEVEVDNYFDQIRALFTQVKSGQGSAETYVSDLAEAMDTRQRYSNVLAVGTERQHLLCTPLPYSEWYLVTVMPYGAIDETITRLGTRWACIAFVACAVVIIALLMVFMQYARMLRLRTQEIEAARQEAVNANKAKSEFLSNMSHDIRTPMNAIVGMTAVAIANIENKQQVANCLKRVALSSRHLLGLINDVLDMSKIESGKMTLNKERISLREVMDNIVNVAQPQMKAKKQNFDVVIYDIAVENVCCDGVRLNQVLLNLASNAIKFTPDGGSVRISLYEENSPKGTEYIRVHIRVKDTGIGMTTEFKEKIFESFTREDSARVHKTEGTGLGMAITKYIVDAMEGEIEVNSEPGKGSEFHVTLDLEKAVEQEADMVLPAWRMLVVDDDRMLCETAAASLKEIGIQAEWTLDGESALRLADEHHQKQEDYQVILLDWKLPGMDGVETAKELHRRIGQDVPILLISAYDWSEIEEDARAAGVSGFISKPLFKSTLYYGLKNYAKEFEQDPVQETVAHTSLRGKHVLLAEDNELNWDVAEELLKPLELELEWAENGQICLERFEKSQVGFYDAILMDIRMPVMNGYEATKAIRALDRADANIPIIAMTADAFSEDVQKCLACGMNAHLSKPIDEREVELMLVKYIVGNKK